MEKQLFTDDLVARKETRTEYGIVERTHEDVDTHVPYPSRNDLDDVVKDRSVAMKLFKRFLKDGIPPPDTVFIRWHNDPRATLISTSKLELLDRSLLIGDVVKRSSRDAMSGVVINASTKCVLQQIGEVRLSGIRGDSSLQGHLPPGQFPSQRNTVSLLSSPAHLVDIPVSELKFTNLMNEEDLFVYKDRLGRIEELVCHVTLKLLDNCVVEIHENELLKVDGSAEAFAVGDIASGTKSIFREQGKWIFGKYNPNTPPIGTVVAIRIVSAEVTWLQRRIGAAETEDPPSVLESDELEAGDFHIYDRSRLPKRGTLDAPLPTVSYSEIDMGLGLRIRFKDLAGASVKYDGTTYHGTLRKIDRRDTLGYDLNVFEVVKYRTDVTVQWQDLSITHESSIHLLPDSSIDDEHAAWPGEIAHTLDFAPTPTLSGMTRPSRVGVVQTVNASERMATLRWSDGGYVQYHENPNEAQGTRTMILGVVGRAAGEEEDLSLYDIEAPGSMNVRRGDIALLMNQARNSSNEREENNDINWLGEIVDTCLDGTLTVRLGAATEVRDVQVPREHVHVAVRSDGTDVPDEWEQEGWDEEMESGDDSGGSSASEDLGAMSENDHDGLSDDSDEESLQATYEDENGVPLDEDEVEDEDWESESSDGGDVDMIDAPPLTPPTSHSVTPPQPQAPTNHDRPQDAWEENGSNGPESYTVLEGAPPTSHRYVNEPSTQSTAHMKRVQKEHKILRSPGSLPSGVYVRTWESRMDLIRVLFVGPAETPYADAPFVIDFYLSSTFPAEPPRSFFHSWTLETSLGGVGRVNPNLYEDGKICLSLLGTWDGSKSEGWSASRSTLLQVIVSILGLVLVREPYFNEAGYEPLAGLESSKRPSALYNERTYLRANSFIVKALDWINSSEGTKNTSIEGLDDVVRWLYKDADGKRLLQRKVQEVDDILKRSESGTAEPDGLMSMSKGACIPLRRVLARLKEL